MTSIASVHGFVAPGCERVLDAFEEVLGESGGAFAAMRGDEPLIDVWGGGWRRDTIAPIFSGTKGLVAASMLMLVARGTLDLDAPVARYWTEFATAGKDDVRLRDVLAHRARLPGIAQRLQCTDLLHGGRLAALLAAQPPMAEAGNGPCYHPLTFGWLCDELVWRVDGRTVGRFFAEEVARPLDLDAWIGLPRRLERRVAALRPGPRWGSAPHLDAARLAREPALRSVWANPPVLTTEWRAWNRRDFHAAEIPAANGIAAARSMARLYARLARDDDTVSLVARSRVAGTDPFMGVPVAFGAGFELQTELEPFGPSADAFGHAGAGGSIHGAWPSLDVGFSFVPDELRGEDDTRARELLVALHGAMTA
jgi:CubicO group peptidase (beta-lactamase class C family)